MWGGVKVINHGYARIKKYVTGTNNLIVVGNESTLHNTTIRIRGNNNRLVIGDKCFFGDACSIWMEGDNIQIIIGEHTTLTRLCHINAQESNQRITIGDDCMFSNNIVIRTSDSHPIYCIDSSERLNVPQSISIGNHVWIAPSSSIYKGVIIGDGAIIGSHSLVTHNVPENSLAVGIPARIIKERVRWTRENLF